MRNLKVLDMSHYQTISNLDGMKAAGIIGVIHKATQGTSWTDEKYTGRRSWLKDNGFGFASYHFLEHGNVEKQMAHYVAFATPKSGEIVVIDYEKSDVVLDDLKKAVAWLRTNFPKNPICIYGGSLLKEHLGKSKMEWLVGTYLWIAHYTTKDAPTWPTTQWPEWTLWQYSDGAAGGSPHAVTGVSQVDCDQYNGTDDECRGWFGMIPAKPVIPVIPVVPDKPVVCSTCPYKPDEPDTDYADTTDTPAVAAKNFWGAVTNFLKGKAQ